MGDAYRTRGGVKLLGETRGVSPGQVSPPGTASATEELEYRRLDALRQIAAASISSAALDGVLAVVAERSARALGMDAAIAAAVDSSGWATAAFGVELAPSSVSTSPQSTIADGLVARTVASRRPIVLTADAAGHSGSAVPPGFAAAVGVPLAAAGEVIGALILLSRRVHPAVDTPPLMAVPFAAAVATALHARRVYRAAAAAREETEALARISRELTESLNLEQLLDVILGKTMQLAGADLAYIALTQSDGTARAVGALGHRIATSENTFVRPGCGLAGLALATGDVVEAPDYAGHAPTGESHPAALDEGARSVLVLPLKLHGRIVGLLWVARRSPGPFSEQTKNRLMALGTSAATALENARLYREVAQKNTELEIANSTLAETLQIQSEFLTNISHEMRTPLSSILGLLRLILDGLCESDAEKEAFIAEAHGSGQHLLTVINDLLDLTKIEAGKLKIDIGSVDLRGLFDEVFAILRVQADAKGLALTFEPPALAWRHVQADAARLKQVLLNLVGNSLKFTDEGSICVRATANPQNGFMTIDVVDTGIGIAPSRQARLFQKFVQADGSTTRKYGGTGLGLAISKHLVEIMGGIIALKSAGHGQGTTATVSLPLSREGAPGDAPVPATSNAAEVQGPNETPLILVVDDNSGIRVAVSEFLHEAGFQTTEAGSADEALELASRLHPALALVDLALSCPASATLRTGVDLIGAMIRKPDLRLLPVILLTGAPSEARTLLRNLEAPVSLPILEKPLDFERLRSTIEIVLAQRGRRSSP